MTEREPEPKFELPKFALHKRLDRKAALASLQKCHAEIDRIHEIFVWNKKVRPEILNRRFTR
jgi:hypothetical protein